VCSSDLTQARGFLRSKNYPNLKRVFFLGQEKHRGMYSLSEVLGLAAMTSAQDYRLR
jgi:fatty-acyl-CoA synthase